MAYKICQAQVANSTPTENRRMKLKKGDVLRSSSNASSNPGNDVMTLNAKFEPKKNA